MAENLPARREDQVPAHRPESGVPAPIPQGGNDITITNGIGGQPVRVYPKVVKVAGKAFNLDPSQLIRMIRNVTQTIGEYKQMDNPYSAYIVNSLRKARADMVSDLETHFHINWRIDETTGKCLFWM